MIGIFLGEEGEVMWVGEGFEGSGGRDTTGEASTDLERELNLG
jgi:hypothetical protein